MRNWKETAKAAEQRYNEVESLLKVESNPEKIAELKAELEDLYFKFL